MASDIAIFRFVLLFQFEYDLSDKRFYYFLQRYRGYCTRRIARLRKALKIVQGDRKRFVKKDITVEILETAAKTNSDALAEAKHLQVVFEQIFSLQITVREEL